MTTLRGRKIKCLIFRFYCVFFANWTILNKKRFFEKKFLDHSIGPFGPYWVTSEVIISKTRFFPDMRFSQDVSRYFVLSISAIKSAYSMVRFSAKCQKPHFLAHICNFWMIQNFWPKKGSVSFFLLSISNFMQKIRMISWPVFEKKWWRTNGLTN